jgi:hypothetical protein
LRGCHRKRKTLRGPEDRQPLAGELTSGLCDGRKRYDPIGSALVDEARVRPRNSGRGTFRPSAFSRCVQQGTRESLDVEGQAGRHRILGCGTSRVCRRVG